MLKKVALLGVVASCLAITALKAAKLDLDPGTNNRTLTSDETYTEIKRLAGETLRLTLGGHTFGAKTTAWGGFVGGWALINKDFVSELWASPYPWSVISYDGNTWGAGKVTKLTANTTITGATTTGALLVDKVNLTMDNTLTINSGGLILRGNRRRRITGGSITSGKNELFVHTFDATKTIGSVISGSSVSLVKTGSAKLVLSGTNTYAGKTYVNEGTLRVTGTIVGNGVVVRNSATFENAGSVSGGLSMLDGSDFSNSGTINGAVSVADGATLTNNAAVTGTVSLSNGATLTNTTGTVNTVNMVGGATVNNSATISHLNMDGGTFTGGGTVSDFQYSSGTIGASELFSFTGNFTVVAGHSYSPGHSPGRITIDGNFTSNGTLNIEANGTVAGTEYDQVVVNNGTVTLSGDLSLTLGFSPDTGTDLTIIDNDGTDDVVGTFSNYAEGAKFTLQGADGFDDICTITYQGGDGNDVVVTVPEPTSMMLLLMGVLGLVVRRKRK